MGTQNTYLWIQYKMDRKEKSDIYRVEPYVICADIYSQAPFVRRGGWTWYTGSVPGYTDSD